MRALQQLIKYLKSLEISKKFIHLLIIKILIIKLIK